MSTPTPKPSRKVPLEEEVERAGFEPRAAEVTMPIDLAQLSALLDQAAAAEPEFGATLPPAKNDSEEQDVSAGDEAEAEFASDGGSIAEALMKATGDFAHLTPVPDKPMRARPARITPAGAMQPARAPPSAETLLARAHDLEKSGDLAGALRHCEQILVRDAGDERARQAAHRLRDVLGSQAEVRLGGLDQVPVVLLDAHRLKDRSGLDARSVFLLSLVDGRMTYRDLLSISGMSRFDTLIGLARLHAERVIRSGT